MTPLFNRLNKKIRIVLDHTSHPGNIGQAARAMKTMGFTNLYLVAPKSFPDPKATALASHADDILENAQVVDTLDEALKDCTLVYGSSARNRELAIAAQSPVEMAKHIINEPLEAHGDIAILFGTERTGLDNHALSKCHFQVVIDTNPDYSSLNLAQAVQVICYQLQSSILQHDAQRPNADFIESYANAQEMEQFYGHLEMALMQIGFLDPKKPKKLLPRLKRMFVRNRLYKTEVKLLRGICAMAMRNASDRENHHA